MAIAFGESDQAYVASGTTASITLTIAAKSTICTGYRAATGLLSSVSDDNGNSYSEDASEINVDGMDGFIHSAHNCNSGSTVITSTTSSATTHRFAAHEVTTSTALELDQTNSGNGNTSSPDSGNITTTAADEYLFGVTVIRLDRTFTAGGAWTEREVVQSRVHTQDRVVSSTLTESSDTSLGSSAWWAALIASYKETAGGVTYYKTNTGSLTPVGTLTKSTKKALAGSTTPAGALSTIVLFTQAVAGSLTPSGALTKKTQKVLAGSITFAGALVKKTSRTLTGSLTPAGTLVKKTRRALVGSITPTGTLATVFTATITLVGSITPSGIVTTVKGLATVGVAFLRPIYYKIIRKIYRKSVNESKH